MIEAVTAFLFCGNSCESTQNRVRADLAKPGAANRPGVVAIR